MSHHGVGIERHHHTGNTEVRHGQRDDEVVGDVLERPLLGHGKDDQHVAEDDQDTEDEEEEGPVVLVVERVRCRGGVTAGKIKVLSSFQ